MWALDAAALEARHADLEIEVDRSIGGEPRIRVDSRHASTLLSRLRDDETLALIRLIDLTAIDRGASPGRFEVVYRLDSVDRRTPVRVHAQIVSNDAATDELEGHGVEPTADSVVTLWPVARWLEREVFDLFGIRFRGHPELRRLLLDDGFEGAPLRKDFPRAGSTSEGPAPSRHAASAPFAASGEEPR